MVSSLIQRSTSPRAKTVVPAGLKGYFEIDEPGSITEVLYKHNDAGAVTAGEGASWKENDTDDFPADEKKGMLERLAIASAVSRGHAVILDSVDAGDNDGGLLLVKALLLEGSRVLAGKTA